MNEAIETITQLITNVGFPIACCCVMFWQNSKLRESLDKNTTAIIKLSKFIDKDILEDDE